MSRLDDELRKAFGREQPPVDFTTRLLERVAQQPAPKAPWWHRLATLLDPPKLRWVAIGVTASLLLAIGAAQYSRLTQAVVDDSGKIAKIDPAPEASAPRTGTTEKDLAPQEDAITATPPRHIRRAAPTSTNRRFAQARHQQDRELRAEGEAAKEQLMRALSIASSALSDAQKAVHGDGLEP
jgi:hypothetical protein